MSTQITASFTFDSWDEEEVLDTDGVRVVRTTFVKRFTGGLQGSSRGEMLMAYAPENSAAYTGFELMEVSAEGRTGTFVLRHNAVMADGAANSEVVVLAGSGSAGFAGLSGTASIDRHEDGSHTVELDLVVPGES